MLIKQKFKNKMLINQNQTNEYDDNYLETNYVWNSFLVILFILLQIFSFLLLIINCTQSYYLNKARRMLFKQVSKSVAGLKAKSDLVIKIGMEPPSDILEKSFSTLYTSDIGSEIEAFVEKSPDIQEKSNHKSKID